MKRVEFDELEFPEDDGPGVDALIYSIIKFYFFTTFSVTDSVLFARRSVPIARRQFGA